MIFMSNNNKKQTSKSKCYFLPSVISLFIYSFSMSLCHHRNIENYNYHFTSEGGRLEEI